MSRKKQRQPPQWAIEDNPYSSFALIYSDLLKSKKYQDLSCAGRLFLITLMVQSRTKESQECLYNALKERYELLEIQRTEFDLNAETHDQNLGLFVFSKSQYEKYGFGNKYVSKYFKELKEAGFIKVIQQGKTSRKVNIYQFSTDWKK